MGDAQLIVLGAGTILPRTGYGPSGYALRPAPGERVTLLDCGPGSVRALAAAGIGLAEVERVLISHFHADHCLDLFALGFARGNPGLGELPPLELLGPVGLQLLLESGMQPPVRWLKNPRWSVSEVELDARGRWNGARAGCRLSCAANGHTAEALSWRVDLDAGPSLAYSGDTPPCPALEELAQGVDLFVLECSHPDGAPEPRHLTPSSAARAASTAQARSVLLTHFYPELDPELARAQVERAYPGVVRIARDGAGFALR